MSTVRHTRLIILGTLALAGFVLVQPAPAQPALTSSPTPAPGLYEGQANVLLGHVSVVFRLSREGRIEDLRCACASDVTWHVSVAPVDSERLRAGGHDEEDILALGSEPGKSGIVAYLRGRWITGTSVQGDGGIYFWDTRIDFAWHADRAQS